jgi:transmembrane sensor
LTRWTRGVWSISLRYWSPQLRRSFLKEAQTPSICDTKAATAGVFTWRRVVGFLAAAIIAFFAWHDLWVSSAAEVYATAIGEQRPCKLEDGSVVILNTDSRVEVRYTRDQRNLRLLRGEALFTVEKDPKRPFIVDAGNVGVHAVGTRFDVYRRSQATDVSVIEGVVQLGPKEQDGTRVYAGEQAHVASGVTTINEHANIAAAISWRERRLVFHDAPLSAVVEEFNRYNRRQIRLEGDAGRQMRLTATFDNDKPESLLLYLKEQGSLSAQEEGANWAIRVP